jgi:hypothetical protein
LTGIESQKGMKTNELMTGVKSTKCQKLKEWMNGIGMEYRISFIMMDDLMGKVKRKVQRE